MEAIVQKEQPVTGARKWILIATALGCALMELIDSTVVGVARPAMMGNLGATTLEIAWVVSAYAIGNLITVPLSAMFSNLFGRKIYFTASVVLFTFSSLICGMSSSLWMLILWRFLQGLGGGALLATAQSIIADSFPPKDLPFATAIFGVGLMIGPAIGPVIGGYIVESFTWNWIFFVNVPIGILGAVFSWMFIPNLTTVKKITKIDWWGIGFLIIWVCALEYFFEEGSANYWFDSTKITVSFVIAIAGLIAFIWRELICIQPAVNIKLYKNLNLALGHLMNLILGVMVVCMSFIFPLFVQDTLGWTAIKQGTFFIPVALFSAVFMMIVSKVVLKVISMKTSAIIGICMFSLFLFLLSFSTPDSGERNFFGPYILNAAGKAFVMVPLMSLALVGLRGEELAQATGLSNIMRQLGSAIGVTLITLYLNTQNTLVSSNLVGYINNYNAVFTSRISAYTQKLMSAGYDVMDATHGAYALVQSAVNKQVQILSYDNAYRGMAVVLLTSILVILFIKNPKK